MLILNGIIHTMDGETIDSGFVQVKGTRIQEVGHMSKLPPGAELDQVIDARGGHVLPGLLDIHCHLGLYGTGTGWEGDDLNEATNKTAMSETLDFCKYLIGNGYTQENLKLKDYRAAFGAGNVCMYVDQSWGYAQIGEVDPNAANFTVTAPLPTQLGTNGKGLSLISSHSFLFGAGLDDSHKEAIDLFIQYCTSSEVMEEYLNTIGLAFPAHENMADVKISPILEGAAAGVNNTVYQPMPAALASVQTELATAALNYCVNGMSLEDTIADYITQAEYYMNQ